MAMIEEGRPVRHKPSGDEGRIVERDIFTGKYKVDMGRHGMQTLAEDDVEELPATSPMLAVERTAKTESKVDHEVVVTRRALLEFLRTFHRDIPIDARMCVGGDIAVESISITWTTK